VKRKNSLKKFLFFCITIIAVAVIAYVFLYFKSYIFFHRVDESVALVEKEIAQKSTPIIVNNIVVGGVSNGKFVTSDKYFLYSENKKDVSVKCYNTSEKIGEYKINSVSQEKSVVYVSLEKELLNEYIAVPYDIETFNVLNTEEILKENFLFYQSGIKVDSKIVIMSFLFNKNNSYDFEIYKIKFIVDLNNDGNKEVIIQSVSEDKTFYKVFELQKNNYYEILSVELK